MVTKFNTAAAPAATSGSGGGNLLLWAIGIGLVAWGVYHFVIKPKQEEKKAQEQVAAQ